MIIERFIEFWLIGSFISFIVLNLCDILSKDKDKINSASFWLGVSFSWFIIFYFTVLVFRGYKNKIAQNKVKAVFAKLSDAEMIKTTIDEYWVPATMYGEEFDNDPGLPIKGSPLCKVYYDTNNRIVCRNCPINRAGFGCTAVGFYLKYQKSTEGTNRKRAAMILGKVFGDIYEELK